MSSPLIDPVSAGIFLFVNSAVALFGTFGNILVIAAFFVSKLVRSTKYNYFLLSLAVADLLACLVCIPIWNFVLYTESKPKPPISLSEIEGLPPANKTAVGTGQGDTGTDHTFNVYLAYHSYLDPLFGVASIMNLLAVSLVRWYAVYFPVRYSNLEYMYFIISAFVFPWGIGLCALLYLRYMEAGFSMVIFVIVIFFIPLLIIMVLYGLIIASVGISRISNTAEQASKHVVMIGVVVACFTICWTPFFCVTIVFHYCHDCMITLVGMGVIKTLQYINSLMNVFIYAWQCKDFRDAFRKIFNAVFSKCRRSGAHREPAWKEMGASTNSLAPVFSVEI